METNRIIVLFFYCSFSGKKFVFKGELLKLFVAEGSSRVVIMGILVYRRGRMKGKNNVT